MFVRVQIYYTKIRLYTLQFFSAIAFSTCLSRFVTNIAAIWTELENVKVCLAILLANFVQ